MSTMPGGSDENTSPHVRLNEAARPLAPRIDGVTPPQRERGRRLALYHQIHLGEMATVRRMMHHIEEDGGSAALRDAVAAMQMTANFRTFGNLCGRECEMLKFHHTAEDAMMFPVLRHRSEGLDRVIDKLSQEHDVIHSVLIDFENQADAAAASPGPDTYAPLRETFEALEVVVRSHFGYEESQLEEALGFYNVMP